MPRYRNPRTGVVVDIPAELAESIGIYVPVDSAPAKKAEKPTRAEQDDAPEPARRKSPARRKPADD